MSSPKSSPPPGSPTKTNGSGSPVKSGTGSPVKDGSPSKGSRKGSASGTPQKSGKSSEQAIENEIQLPLRKELSEEFYTRPDFIYGGPFIPVKLPSPFLETATPMNMPLQGTFKKYVLKKTFFGCMIMYIQIKYRYCE